MGQQLPTGKGICSRGQSPTPYKEPSKNLKRAVYSARASGRFVTEDEKLLIKNDMRLPKSLMKTLSLRWQPLVLALLKSKPSLPTTSNKQERTS